LVLQLVGAPGHGWLGTGVAFKHAPKRIASTLAALWVAGYDEPPWVLLTDLSLAEIDVAWYALRS
jgi:hypothetical protein